MKIAYVYDLVYPYSIGGAEKRFWELAKRLASNGHQVHIYGMKLWQGNHYFIKDGVHVHGVGINLNRYLKIGIRNPFQILFFVLFLLPRFYREKFDIIDCNAFPYIPFFLIRLFSFLRNTPLVTTWQEVWGNYWYEYLGCFIGFVGCLIERLTIRLSENVIAHTKRVKNHLITYGFKEEKIEIIPNGIDLKLIGSVSINTESSDLIFVGRLIKDKQVDMLVNALSLLKRKIDDIKCIIIGDGPEKYNLISLTQELRLENNVIFKDFFEREEEIFSFLKSSKIFVLPSVREGFGIIVIEAMACGLPVIAVDHYLNASIELIKDNQNGFICEPNANSIAEKTMQLLTDGVLRSNFAKSARDNARKYDWDIVTQKNEEFYLKIINKDRI
ncbi:MAG: glycosyltransferase family 4 protein [Candidatus Omnitrophica bacterium]|nr:glycosyltransferase family 4 protein [Candidatus Omnitrophota bacterium]